MKIGMQASGFRFQFCVSFPWCKLTLTAQDKDDEDSADDDDDDDDDDLECFR